MSDDIDEIELMNEYEERYPTLPKELALSCPNDCPDAEMKLEGYANYYNAVYRCPECGESIVLSYSEEYQAKKISQGIKEIREMKASENNKRKKKSQDQEGLNAED